MQKIAAEVPNRVKQPAKCCVHCGKSYALKTNLDKHVVLCEMLHQSKKRKHDAMQIDDEPQDIPSQAKLFRILLELGHRFNHLEEKVDELSKWVVKKKKKINVVEWLNTNCVPTILFDQLIEHIVVTEEDVRFLFENTFSETLNNLFMRSVYQVTENISAPYPLFAFVQKQNAFYVYEGEEMKWVEASREKLTKFLNRVHMKLLKRFGDWKKENRSNIREDEQLSLLCDKTSVKMMGIDFRQDATYSKTKGVMYSHMKTDIKALIEYEFEF